MSDYLIKVKFPSSEKEYSFIIGEQIKTLLEKECQYSYFSNDYYIINENGYNYKTTPVKFTTFPRLITESDDINELKRIVVIKNSDVPIIEEDIDYWTYLMETNYNLYCRIQESIVSIFKKLNYLDAIIDDYLANRRIKHGIYFHRIKEFQNIEGQSLLKPFPDAKISHLLKHLSDVKISQKEKEKNNMNISFGAEFGKLKDNYNLCKMSLKGLALTSQYNSSENLQKTYYTYNKETHELEDVTPYIIDFDVTKVLFKMPVAVSTLKEGDLILNGSIPLIVKSVNGNEISAISVEDNEVITLAAKKNIFGFSYITKIINIMGDFNLSASANSDNPFGNMLPLMLMSDSEGGMDNLLPLMLMNSANGGSGIDFSANPLMLYFLMKDGKSNDILPFLLMSNPKLFGTQNTSASGTEKN